MTIKRNAKPFFWIVTLVCLLFGGVQIALIAFNPKPGEVIINEFVAVNRAGLTDEDGDYSDWIEIYNRSNQPVNLAGLSFPMSS
jgi:hypothetical protein